MYQPYRTRHPVSLPYLYRFRLGVRVRSQGLGLGFGLGLTLGFFPVGEAACQVQVRGQGQELGVRVRVWIRINTWINRRLIEKVWKSMEKYGKVWKYTCCATDSRHFSHTLPTIQSCAIRSNRLNLKSTSPWNNRFRNTQSNRNKTYDWYSGLL